MWRLQPGRSGRLPLTNSRDAAVLLRVTPGVYSVVVSPVPGTSNGVGLVEIYEVSQ